MKSWHLNRKRKDRVRNHYLLNKSNIVPCDLLDPKILGQQKIPIEIHWQWWLISSAFWKWRVLKGPDVCYHWLWIRDQLQHWEASSNEIVSFMTKVQQQIYKTTSIFPLISTPVPLSFGIWVSTATSTSLAFQPVSKKGPSSINAEDIRQYQHQSLLNETEKHNESIKNPHILAR